MCRRSGSLEEVLILYFFFSLNISFFTWNILYIYHYCIIMPVLVTCDQCSYWPFSGSYMNFASLLLCSILSVNLGFCDFDVSLRSFNFFIWLWGPCTFRFSIYFIFLFSIILFIYTCRRYCCCCSVWKQKLWRPCACINES